MGSEITKIENLRLEIQELYDNSGNRRWRAGYLAQIDILNEALRRIQTADLTKLKETKK